MESTSYALSVMAALFVMVIATRSLPFIFTKFLKNSKTLKIIGQFLPDYIMLLLVIYEVGITHFTRYPYGIPAIIALGVLIIVHLLKRQMLLSILSGTAVYIAMLHLFN